MNEKTPCWQFGGARGLLNNLLRWWSCMEVDQDLFYSWLRSSNDQQIMITFTFLLADTRLCVYNLNLNMKIVADQWAAKPWMLPLATC